MVKIRPKWNEKYTLFIRNRFTYKNVKKPFRLSRACKWEIFGPFQVSYRKKKVCNSGINLKLQVVTEKKGLSHSTSPPLFIYRPEPWLIVWLSFWLSFPLGPVKFVRKSLSFWLRPLSHRQISSKNAKVLIPRQACSKRWRKTIILYMKITREKLHNYC